MDVVLVEVQDDVVEVEEEDVEVVYLATRKRWMKVFFEGVVVVGWNAFRCKGLGGFGVGFYSGGVWIKIPGFFSRHASCSSCLYVLHSIL